MFQVFEYRAELKGKSVFGGGLSVIFKGMGDHVVFHGAIQYYIV